MSSVNVAAIPAQSYTGSAIEPDLDVTFNKLKLVRDVDYTATFQSNVNVGQASVTLTSTENSKNFSGSKSVTFAISPADISKAMVTIPDVVVGDSPAPIVKTDQSGDALNLNSDYVVSYSAAGDGAVISGGQPATAGTYTAVITGTGNYTGKVTGVTFNAIDPDDQLGSLDGATVTTSNPTYTGQALEPAVTVTLANGTVLNANYYSASYVNNTNVSFDDKGAITPGAEVTVVGRNGYVGSANTRFAIQQAELTTANLSEIAQMTITPTALNEWKAAHPNDSTAPVTPNDDGLTTGLFTVTYEGQVKTVDVDYTLSFTWDDSPHSLDSGESYYVAKAKVNGKGNFKTLDKDLEKEYRILVTTRTLRELNDSQRTVITVRPSSYSYDGTDKEPSVTVKYNTGAVGSTNASDWVTLKNNEDYTVSYRNNRDMSTVDNKAVVVVTAKAGSDYIGAKEATFDITKAEVKKSNVADIANQVYTGSQITPEATVTFNGKVLTRNVDYTVSYGTNTNVADNADGKNYVKVTGIGNYTGEATKTFAITPADMSNAQVSGLNSVVYNLQTHEPEVEVMFNNDMLYNGGAALDGTALPNDYTLTFTDADGNAPTWTDDDGIVRDGMRDAGTYIAHIASTSENSNFTGTKEAEFVIDPASIVDAAISVSAATITNVSQGQRVIDPQSVTVIVMGGTELVMNRDFTVKYNTPASLSDNVTVGSGTATFTGVGNFTGSATATYDVVRSAESLISIALAKAGEEQKVQVMETLGNEDVALTGDTATDSVGYTGSAVTKNLHLVTELYNATYTKTDYQLIENLDYTASYESNIEVGTGSVVFTGKVRETPASDLFVKVADTGNNENDYAPFMGFTGYRKIKFDITPVELTEENVTVSSETYTGDVLTPTVSVEVNGKALSRGADYRWELLSDDAYNNIDLPQGQILLVGHGNYTTANDNAGIKVNFDITKAKIAGGQAVVSDVIVSESAADAEDAKPVATLIAEALHADGAMTLSVNGRALSPEYVGGALSDVRDYDVTYRAVGNNATLGEDGMPATSGTYMATFTAYEGKTNAAYTGNTSTTFTVTVNKAGTTVPTSLAKATVSIDDQTYTGNALTPSPVVTLNDATLVEGTHYTVSYENNVNASQRAIAVVEGIGAYTGVVAQRFTINPANINAAGPKIANMKEEDQGTKVLTPIVRASFNGSSLEVGSDYEIEYNPTTVREHGEYTATMTGVGNFTGTATLKFTVYAYDDASAVDISSYGLKPEGRFTYDGTAKTLLSSQLSLAKTDDDGNTTDTLLVSNMGFGVSYSNNVNAGASDGNGGWTKTAQVTVVANSAKASADNKYYYGEVKGYFLIEPASLATASTQASVDTTSYDAAYDGSTKRPSVSVSYAGRALTEGSDYTLTYPTETAVGDYGVTVTGAGNYTDSASAPFSITKRTIQDGVPSIPATVETSQTDPDETLVVGGRTLTRGVDYEVEYARNITTKNLVAGNNNVTFRGIGNYDGTLTTTYSVLESTLGAVDLAGVTFKLVDDDGNDYVTETYDGTAKTPKVKVVTNDTTSAIVEDLKEQTYNADGTVKEAGDYKVTYANNVNYSYRGASVIITAVENAGRDSAIAYGKNDSLKFSIDAAEIRAADIADIADETFNGAYHTPEVTVTKFGQTLKRDVDYEIASYENNLRAGTATVVVKGVSGSNYTSSNGNNGTRKNFTIVKADLSGASVSATNAEYVPNGGAVPSAVTVKLGDTVIQRDNSTTGTHDYALSYKGNGTPGTATVIVNADYTSDGEFEENNSNYTGTATGTYQVVAKNIDTSSYEPEGGAVADQTYTGSPLTPLVSVYAQDGSGELKKGVDYTVTYLNNTNICENYNDVPVAQRPTAVLKGLTNYGGTKNVYFNILKAPLSDANVGDIAAQTYTGSPIVPSISLDFNGQSIVVDESVFTVGVENNTNVTQTTTTGDVTEYVDSATVTITLPSDKTHSIFKSDTYTTGSFVIVPADADDIDATANDVYMPEDADFTAPDFTAFFNGVNVKEQFKIGGYATKDGVDINGTPSAAGAYMVKLVPVALDGEGHEDESKLANFDGVKTVEFNVVTEKSGTITRVEAYDATYTGGEVKPGIKVYYKADDAAAEQEIAYDSENPQYAVEYSNNVAVKTWETGSEPANAPRVIVKGLNGYLGSASDAFQIKPISFVSDVSTEKPLVVNAPSKVYNGQAQTPDVTVTYNGSTLNEGIDYTVSGGKLTDAGTASFTVTGKGNYADEATGTFTVTKGNLADATVVVSDFVAAENASENDLSIKALLNGASLSGTAPVGGKADYEIDLTQASDSTKSVADILKTPGDYTVAIKATGNTNPNYTGQNTATFRVISAGDVKGDLSGATINGARATAYTGSAITQSLSVKLNSVVLTEGTHYVVEYADNVNVGTASIVVRGIGGYIGSQALTFNITPRNINNVAASFIVGDLAYTGSSLVPVVTASYGIEGLTVGNDYTVSYAPGDVRSVGSYTATFTGIGNYAGTRTETFNVVDGGKSIDNVEFKLYQDAAFKTAVDDGTYTYTGSSIVPYVHAESALLVEGADYTLKYLNNVNAGTASVVVLGKGDYVGTKTLTFRISQADISKIVTDSESGDYRLQGFTQSGTLTYTGKPQLPAVANTIAANLVQGVDFEVSGTPVTDVKYKDGGDPTNVKDVTTAGYVTVKGMGNYTGTVTRVPFTITPKSIDEASVVVSNVAKASDTPSALVELDGVALGTNDYYVGARTATSENNVFATSVKGMGNYQGERSGLTYRFIESGTYDLSKATITTVPASAEYTYDGTAKVPESVKVTMVIDEQTVELAKDTDYSIAYSDNVNVTRDSAGNVIAGATITIVGRDDYIGSKTAKYTIKPRSIAGASIAPIADQSYTGETVVPSTDVSLAGMALIEDVDYTLQPTEGEGIDNVNVSTNGAKSASVSAWGKGNYDTTTSVSQAFSIVPPSLDDDNVTVDFAVLSRNDTYANKEIKPVVVVKVDGVTVFMGTTNSQGQTVVSNEGGNFDNEGDTHGLTVTYDNNVNATTATSKATVTVTGNGTQLSGSKKLEFDIAPAALEAGNVTITAGSYTGSEVEATVRVDKAFGTQSVILTQDTDYTVEYHNNVDAATASGTFDSKKPYVTVTGIGNYTGTIEKNFAINQVNLSTAGSALALATDGKIFVEGDAGKVTADDLDTTLTLTYGVNSKRELIRSADGKTGDYTVELVKAVDNDGTTTYQAVDSVQNVGTYLVRVNGIKNYMGSYVSNVATAGQAFTISKADLKSAKVSVADFSTASSSAADKPVPVVTLNGTTVPADQYDVKFYNESGVDVTDAVDWTKASEGEYTAVVSAKDGEDAATATAAGAYNYTGTAPNATFRMVNKSSEYYIATAASDYVLEQTTFGYNGQAHEPGIDANQNYVNKLTLGTDYTLTWEDNVHATVGDHQAKAIMTGVGDYYGTKELEFEITQVELSDNYITVSNVTDADVTPAVSVRAVADDGTVLYPAEGEDYTYAKVAPASEGSTHAREPRVQVTAVENGNYSGQRYGYYKIYGDEDVFFDISKAENYTFALDDDSFTFTGNEILAAANSNLKVTKVTAAEGAPELTEKATVTGSGNFVVTYHNNVAVNDWTTADESAPTVVITAVGGNTKLVGSVEIPFKITKASIEDATVTLAKNATTYNGLAQVPAVTVKLGSDELVEGSDYVVTYTLNNEAVSATDLVNAGEYTVTVSAAENGNYSGTAKAQPTFTIGKAEITADMVTLGTPEGGYIYDGTAKTPSVSVAFNGVTLEQGDSKDYVFNAESDYGDNVAAGDKAYALLHDADGTNFKISASEGLKAFFAIGQSSLRGAQVSVADILVGDRPNPVVTLVDGTTVLPAGYTVAYAVAKTNTDEGARVVNGWPATPGRYTATVTGSANFAKETVNLDPVEFNVIDVSESRAVIADSNVTFKSNANTVTYDGTEQRPFVVKVGDTILTEGVDYDIAYANNVNATGYTTEANGNSAVVTMTDENLASATITGKNGYTGTVSKTFQIQPADLSTTAARRLLDVTVGAVKSYGNATDGYATPNVLVTYNGKVVDATEGGYTVSTFKSDKDTSKRVAIITGMKNFVNSSDEYEYDENPNVTADLNDGTYKLVINNGNFAYTGKAIELTSGTDFQLVKVTGNSETAVNDNYKVGYTNNTNVTYEKGEVAAAATIIVTGTGTTTGSLTGTFKITPKDIAGSTVSVASGSTYSGKAQTPAVTVANPLGGGNLASSDFSVEYVNNVNATGDSSKATATVTGKGNFTGTATGAFEIAPYTLTAANVGVIAAAQPYTGSGVEPAMRVTFNGSTLGLGDDYSVAYADNTEVGIGAATVSGAGNFTGTVRRTFTISKASLGNATIAQADVKMTNTTTVPAITPVVTLGAATVDAANYELKYEVSGSGELDESGMPAGEGVYKVTAVALSSGNFIGSTSTTFRVVAAGSELVNLADAGVVTFGQLNSSQYTGEGITYNSIIVKSGGATIEESGNYTIAYSNNVNAEGANVASVTVAALPASKAVYGSVTQNFTVEPRPISENGTYANGESGVYRVSATTVLTGETPRVTLSVNVGTANAPKWRQLTEGTDFKVTRIADTATSSVAEGKTLDLEGIGNFTGTLNAVPFTVLSNEEASKRTDLGTATVTVNAKRTFNGSAQTLETSEIEVKAGDDTLTADVDYTLTYENNVHAGTATVNVVAAPTSETYIGSKTATFTIAKANMSDVSVADIASQTYTGAQATPEVVATLVNYSLAKGTDFTARYSDNVNAAANKASIKLTGTGDFTGTKTVNFTIDKAPLTFGLELSETKQSYGDDVPTATVVLNGIATADKAKMDAAAAAGTTGSYSNPVRYSVTNTGAGANGVGSHTVAVWMLSKPANYSVEGYSLSKPVAAASYTVSAKNIADKSIVAAKPFSEVGMLSDGDTVLESGVDYDVVYYYRTNTSNAWQLYGTGRTFPTASAYYQARITGMGNYDGTRTEDFSIGDISIAEGSIALSQNGTEVTAATNDDSMMYNGKAHNIVSSLSLNGEAIDNRNGDAYSISFAKVETSNGETTLGEKLPATLNADGSFTVPVTDAGTYRVIATGAGLYKDTLNSAVNQFTIKPMPFTSTNINATIEKVTFLATGAPNPVPAASLKTATANRKGGEMETPVALELGTDYTVSYTVSGQPANFGDLASVKADTTVVATFNPVSANFSANNSPTATFVVKKNVDADSENPEATKPALKSIAGATVSFGDVDYDDLTGYEHTGSAIRPSVTVDLGGTLLAEGTDYLVAYTNNVELGRAGITIIGIGAYTGVITKSFLIVPETVATDDGEGEQAGEPEQANDGDADAQGAQGAQAARIAQVPALSLNFGGSGVSGSTSAQAAASEDDVSASSAASEQERASSSSSSTPVEQEDTTSSSASSASSTSSAMSEQQNASAGDSSNAASVASTPSVESSSSAKSAKSEQEGASTSSATSSSSASSAKSAGASSEGSSSGSAKQHSADDAQSLAQAVSGLTQDATFKTSEVEEAVIGAVADVVPGLGAAASGDEAAVALRAKVEQAVSEKAAELFGGEKTVTGADLVEKVEGEGSVVVAKVVALVQAAVDVTKTGDSDSAVVISVVEVVKAAIASLNKLAATETSGAKGKGLDS